MKYLAIVVTVLMVACSVPPASFRSDSVPVEVTVNVNPKPGEDRERELEPKHEPKPKAVIKLPSCKGIDTGDEKESLNLKLDCMLDGK